MTITTLAEDNHWWFATRTWSLLNMLDAHLPRRDGKVLDIGCGAGNMMHHLARYGHVQGVEVDARPVAMARARGYDVQQGDATRRLTFEEASFDLVTILDVLEHVEDDVAMLREAYRVTRPRGWLAITTPAFQALWSYNDEINGHKRRYTPHELRTRVQSVGFRVRRLTFGFFLVFPLAAPLILLRNRLGTKKQLRSHHLSQDEYQVEMEPVAPPINTILRAVGRLEATLVASVDLPIGTSLMCLAEKV
jgi:SAM-dependent methyltransferase